MASLAEMDNPRENEWIPPPELKQWIPSLLEKRRELVAAEQKEPLNPKTGMFPSEESACRVLCEGITYLDEPDQRAVMDATAWCVHRHSTQWRKSGEPYATHPLWIANQLAGELQLDWVTIVSALLHDVVEDAGVTREELTAKFGSDVSETVLSLTEMRARHTAKYIVDEKHRLQIITSILENPRVAIIKIYDRLHNMLTLSAMPARNRRRTIRETEEVYVPLAQRVGMFEEAEALDLLCLEHLGPEYQQFAQRITETLISEYPQGLMEEMTKKMGEFLSEYKPEIIMRKPTGADVYRGIGEIRQLYAEDFSLQVDIVLTSKDKEPVGELIERMVGIAVRFAVRDPERYMRREEIINVNQLREEFQNGISDALSFSVLHVPSNRWCDVRVFSQEAYQIEHTPITDMYARIPRAEGEQAVQESAGIPNHQILALRKLAHLREQYEKKIKKYIAGDWTASEILRQLEPRQTHGHIRIYGKNAKGVVEPASIREGATVMDFAAYVYPKGWNRFQRAELIEKEERREVPPYYTLRPRDRVHIVFGDPHWNPVWIHSFRTFPTGPKSVRRNIRKKIKGKNNNGEDPMRPSMEDQILATGWFVLSQNVQRRSGKNAPLRVGLSSAQAAILKAHPEYGGESWARQFYFDVGMGEIPPEELEEVAGALVEPNNNVQMLRASFSKNVRGQAAAVLRVASELGISLPDIGAVTFDESGSQITLYIDPGDIPCIQKLSDAILSDPECKDLGCIRVYEASAA